MPLDGMDQQNTDGCLPVCIADTWQQRTDFAYGSRNYILRSRDGISHEYQFTLLELCMHTHSLTSTAIVASILTMVAHATPSADFDQNGEVGSTDLIILTAQLNLLCDGECPTDLNTDGVTDIGDLLLLLQQLGSVQNNVVQEITSQDNSPTSGYTQGSGDMSWHNKGPVLFDAIYYDQYTRLFSHGGYNRWHNAEEYNQGEYTKSWCNDNQVDVQSMVYGSVDWDHDGELSEEDKTNFVIWLDEIVPVDYDGPICLDLEGQWWSMLDTNNQAVMDHVISFYLEGLEFAKSLRPNAKIGYWGLPKKSHTNPDYQTASLDDLLQACTAIFPDVYENNPNGNDYLRLKLHIERAIAMVHGQIPVYVQTSPRYKINSNGYRYFHDINTFIRDQVHSSLDAMWTDESGYEHRISGIALWDAYVYVGMYTDGWSELTMETRKEHWNEVDFLHVEFLTEMKTLVDIAESKAAKRRVLSKHKQEEATNVVVSEATNIVHVERKQQRSRLVRILDPNKVYVARETKSLLDRKRAYHSKRTNWFTAKKVFAAVKREYSKGSIEFKRATATYEIARNRMQKASRAYLAQRKSYRNRRALLKQARDRWKASNAKWKQMTATAPTLTTMHR